MASRRPLLVLLVWVMMMASVPLPHSADDGGPAPEARTGSRAVLGAEDAMVKYAILTSSTFADEFQRLAEWKTDKGLYSKVYTTEWVTGAYGGRDSREQYHAFLRDLLNHTGGGLEYVLLGGDDEVIRAREVWTGVKVGWDIYSGAWLYSDHYYAGLDGDWDADGDGRYGELGEEDWDADVSLGRLPVSTVAEARDGIDKLLRYERTPEVGDWMHRAILAASVMNPPNANATNVDPGNESQAYSWWEDNAWESVERTLPLIPGHMNTTVLYDYNETYAGNYTVANDTLNRSSYIGAINEGASILVSTTHGWIPTGNGLPQYNGTGINFRWANLFYYTDIPGLTNGNRTPLAFFSSCYVGNFTEFNDTNFERLVTKADGGAIAVVAPTENTYRGEEVVGWSDGNWWMSETFWSHILNGTPRPGDALFQMKREYFPHIRDGGGNPDSSYFRQNMAAYNLLGDPEMPVWLDTPRALDVALPPYMYDLDYTVPVRVSSGGAPLPGARVCLRGEDFYASAMTNGTGWAALRIAAQREGQAVKVTVTAPQHLVWQDTVGITPSGTELIYVPDTLRAGRVRPEAGAPTTLSAEVRNIGHEGTGDFSVRFYDGDPAAGGVAIGERVDLDPVPSGASVPVVTAWTAPSAGWHEVYVVVDSEGQVTEVLEDDNMGAASVYVSGYDAVLRQLHIKGGGAATLAVNEQSEIEAEVLNEGSIALDGATVRLYLGEPGSGGVQVGTDMTTVTIAPGTWRAVSFTYRPTSVGQFKLVAVTDPADLLPEFDETDNTAELWVKVAHRPTWDAMPVVTMVEDAPKDLDVTRYLHDYDTAVGDLSLSVVSVTTDRVGVSVSGLVVKLTPEEDWSGDFDVTISVTDGDFAVDAALRVSVGARNDAPRFRNVVHEATITEGETWRFQLDAYDPDGDPVSYTDNSEHFDVGADGLVVWAPTWAQIESTPIHVVRFVATDGSAQTYYAMNLVLVANNTAPVLRLPGRLTAKVGADFLYTFQATDREGDALVWSVSFGEDSAIFDVIPTTGQVMFAPTRGMAGEHNVTVRVTDGEHTSQGWVIIEVLGEEEDGGTPAAEYMVLAVELAIVVLCLLYIPYYRARQRREAAQRAEAAREAKAAKEAKEAKAAKEAKEAKPAKVDKEGERPSAPEGGKGKA